jgi:predicted DNA-binding transcriptional regulator AlpA
VRLITFAQLGPEKGISHWRDHVRRLVKVGKFPAPIQLSDHKIAWLEAEIDAMIAARAEERNKKPIDPRPPKPKRLPGRPRKIPPAAEVDSRPAAPLAAAAVE